jgi:hypothetical protein
VCFLSRQESARNRFDLPVEHAPIVGMDTNDNNTAQPLDPIAYAEWLEQYITVPEAAALQGVHTSTFKRHNSHLIIEVGTRARRVKRRHALGV